jgi:hypothetical protein
MDLRAISGRVAAMTLRRGRGIVAGLGLAGAFLLSASPAVAKPCAGHHSPHGNSEANQYSETVPGPCGDQPLGGNGSGHGGNSGAGNGSSGQASGLPPTSITQLHHMGPAGVQAANLAQETSPLGSGNNGKGGSSSSGGSGSGGGSAGGSATGTGGSGSGVNGGEISDGGNPLGALASLVTGGSGDGVGPMLPILLVALLLGGLGFLALMRARPQ